MLCGRRFPVRLKGAVYKSYLMPTILREFSELLYGRRFPVRLKGAVYNCYLTPTILYESEAWCLNESKMGIFLTTEMSILRAMYGVQVRNR